MSGIGAGPVDVEVDADVEGGGGGLALVEVAAGAVSALVLPPHAARSGRRAAQEGEHSRHLRQCATAGNALRATDPPAAASRGATAAVSFSS